jgi:hypothetical protein
MSPGADPGSGDRGACAGRFTLKLTVNIKKFFSKFNNFTVKFKDVLKGDPRLDTIGMAQLLLVVNNQRRS